MATVVGSLLISMGLDSSSFRSGLSASEKSAQRTARKIESIGNNVRGLAASFGGFAAAAGFGALVGNAFQIASSMQEAAAATGVTIEQLQRLRVAAEQNGSSADKMDAALSRLSATLGQAQQGSAPAIAAFENIGLSLDELKGLNAAEAFALIVKNISSITDPALQAAAAKQIFGKSYADLLPLIKGGSAALEEAAKLSKENGELSSEDAAKLDQLADSWENLKVKAGVSIATLIANTSSFYEELVAGGAAIDKWADDFDAAFLGLANAVPGYMQRLYEDVRRWLIGSLGDVWSSLSQQIAKAKTAFFDLYDAVVGNSYIPDMVNEIGQNISRLQQLMVGPIVKATKKSAEAFRMLQSDVASILNRLYPEQARENRFIEELNSLQKLMKALPKDAQLLSAAIGDLETEFFQERITPLLSATPIKIEDTELVDRPIIANFEEAQRKLARAAGIAGQSIKNTNVSIVKSFKDMADETLGSISNLANGIRGGGIVDILQGVLGLFTQLGSIGVFGESLAARINAPVSGARALGGPVTGGQSYLVGERGPEIFTAARSGSIIPNNKIGGGGSNIRVMVEASPYFNATVDQRARDVAAPMAMRAGLAGASLAEDNIARRNRNRIP